jgi:hypothetical protein
VQLNKLKGVIDSSGTEIITPSYSDIILSPTAIIVKNGRSGLFSTDGSMILPCEYESIEFLRPDIAKALTKEKIAIVNLQSGRIILERPDHYRY